MRRLFQECKVGSGNATLLSDALLFAKPEDLKNKDIIRVSAYMRLFFTRLLTVHHRNSMRGVGLHRN